MHELPQRCKNQWVAEILIPILLVIVVYFLNGCVYVPAESSIVIIYQNKVIPTVVDPEGIGQAVGEAVKRSTRP